MKNKTYLVVLCCLLIMSCNDGSVYVEKINGNEMLVCKANMLSSEVKDLPLSELVESVEVIRLETNDNCLIKDIRKVFVTDNYISLIENDQRPCKLFDRKGNFITEIGKVGQGPHEYTSLSYLFIDEKNSRIYIMRGIMANELLCYDLEGNPHGIIPLYYKSLDKASFYIKDDIITVFSMPFTNREVFAFQQNLKGELIKSIPATEEMFAYGYDGELYTSYSKGAYSLHYTSLDTVFHYDTKLNELIPKYRTQFEHDAFKVYSELPNHFITFSMPNNIIVNKKTKKANYYSAQNDFLGGLDIGYFQNYNDFLIVKYNSFQLLEDLKKNINTPNLKKDVRDRMSALISSVDEDDNPVLVIGRLK